MSCIFCRIAAGEIPSPRVLETPDLIAIRDIAPQAPAHLLVIPRRHVESLAALEDASLGGKLLEGVREAARLAGLAEYRLIANTGASAGQTVFHLHFHVLGGRPLGALG